MDQVAPGVHSIKIAHVHVFIVDGDEGVTLIDSGLPKKEGVIEAGLREIGRSLSDVSRILITHAHTDHSGSAAAIKEVSGAEVLASAVDAPSIRGDKPPPVPPVAERIPFLKPLMKRFPSPPGVDVDRLIEEGSQIPGDLTAYETPGHTNWHVSYLLEREDGILFVGDAAVHKKGRIVRGVFNAPTPAIDASIARIGELPFGLACFGHARPLPGARDAFRHFA